MHSARKFFFEKTEAFKKVEIKEFDEDPDPDHIEAGLEIFGKFGDVNQLESLSNGNVTKWPEIKDMELSTIFTKLLLNRDKAKFQKALSEVLKRKYKPK